MRRLLVYALHVAVLVGLCVAIYDSFIGRYIMDIVAAPGKGWAGMGGLLYILADGCCSRRVVVGRNMGRT